MTNFWLWYASISGALRHSSTLASQPTHPVPMAVPSVKPRPFHAGISGASYYEGTFSNVQRGPKGDYVAVSSRGNFFLTWSPGETYWQPHNRPTCGPGRAQDPIIKP